MEVGELMLKGMSGWVEGGGRVQEWDGERNMRKNSGRIKS